MPLAERTDCMNCPRPPGIGLIILVAALVTAPAGQARDDGPAVSPAPQATGAAWTPATLAPNRYWAATTFLPSTCEVLAYGGHSMDASGNVTVSRATLIYQPDLDRWLTYAAQKSGGPPALAHAALTFDPSHSTALLFGGFEIFRVFFIFQSDHMRRRNRLFLFNLGSGRFDFFTAVNDNI